MAEATEQVSPLAPDKYPQSELFICDIADAVLKDIIPMMEHPFFSLSKKPDHKAREYISPDAKHWLTVKPGYEGLPTIWDKDLLIFVVSQIMNEMNQGRNPGRKVWINGVDYLRFTNRSTSGRDYLQLERTMDRLTGVRINTNVGMPEGVDGTRFEGLVDRGEIRRTPVKGEPIDKHGKPREGRLIGFEITLSEWVWDAIEHNTVLSLHSDYFRLAKPIERRIYELARKHCGHKAEFRICVAKLHVKSGSRNTLRQFKWQVKEIIKTNHLPQYSLAYNAEKDQVIFRRRDARKTASQELPKITAEALDDASLYLNDDEIVQDWYGDWLDYWIEKGSERLHDPDAAFLGWCKARRKYRRDNGGKDVGFIEKHTDTSWREGL